MGIRLFSFMMSLVFTNTQVLELFQFMISHVFTNVLVLELFQFFSLPERKNYDC